MKVSYGFLYKNGKEEVITIPEDKIDQNKMLEINPAIYESIQEGLNAVITIPDKEGNTHMIRMSDVSKVILRDESN